MKPAPTTQRDGLARSPWFVVIIAVTLLWEASPAAAGRFINLVETAAIPPGEGEVVQAAAFSTCSGMPCRSDVFEYQVGIEYGLFDRFHAGFALPHVARVWTDEDTTTEVGGTSFWGLYNFLDPGETNWGLSCAAIFTEGPEARAGELALMLEKPLGSWIAVYNGIIGRSWARFEELGSSDGMSHSLGASREISPAFFVGLEADWYLERGQAWQTAGQYVGPNCAVDAGRLWITASAQFAVGRGDVIPDQVFQTQVGFPF